MPELARLDLLKDGDAATLTTYCEMWAAFVDSTPTVKRRARAGVLPTWGVRT